MVSKLTTTERVKKMVIGAGEVVQGIVDESRTALNGLSKWYEAGMVRRAQETIDKELRAKKLHLLADSDPEVLSGEAASWVLQTPSGETVKLTYTPTSRTEPSYRIQSKIQGGSDTMYWLDAAHGVGHFVSFENTEESPYASRMFVPGDPGNTMGVLEARRGMKQIADLLVQVGDTPPDIEPIVR